MKKNEEVQPSTLNGSRGATWNLKPCDVFLLET
jgi:hypothetical protein